MITIEEIEKAIETMKVDDPEKAHSTEDWIYHEVLLAIIEGAENPKELANAALRTDEIDFPRWCA